MSDLKVTPFTDEELKSEIIALKKKKNAVLLAHFYQESAIQDLADYVGDSLGLSQQAASIDAGTIVFAGVHFMAETAKIINPRKKVVIPDLAASCSLSESCPTSDFKTFVESHPDHVVVSYINCSAEIKALSDIICTSANAVKVVESIPEDRQIIFAPDKNLGAFVTRQTGRKMLLWDGACIVHEAFNIDKILKLHEEHPDATFIAHPESEEHILKVAKYVGSTTGMINYVKNNPAQKFIVGTEVGILHQMNKEAPGKILIPAPVNDEACNCSECGFMKMNTLEKLYLCLKNGQPEIDVPENIRDRAMLPIQRMLDLSK